MLFYRYLDPTNSVHYSVILFQAVKTGASSYSLQIITESPSNSWPVYSTDANEVSVKTNELCGKSDRKFLLTVFTDIMAQCL